MFYEQRFRNDGPSTAKSEQMGDRHEKVDERYSDDLASLDHRNQTVTFDKTWKSFELMQRIEIRTPQLVILL